MKTSANNLPTLFPDLTLSDFQLTAPTPVTDAKPAAAPEPIATPASAQPVHNTRGWRAADIAGLAFLAIFYGYLMLHL